MFLYLKLFFFFCKRWYRSVYSGSRNILNANDDGNAAGVFCIKFLSNRISQVSWSDPRGWRCPLPAVLSTAASIGLDDDVHDDYDRIVRSFAVQIARHTPRCDNLIRYLVKEEWNGSRSPLKRLGKTVFWSSESSASLLVLCLSWTSRRSQTNRCNYICTF